MRRRWPLPASGPVRAAATGADAYLSEETAAAIASQFPLQIDGFEQAMRLARDEAAGLSVAPDPRNARFHRRLQGSPRRTGASRLVQRIEPLFTLDDVVLPPDRKEQLERSSTMSASRQVLDGWKFRDQLPYGRGVTALFHGPSGTGKTMAAIGVAQTLGVQILRIDLSRVVSKYIGDTEKNIDRVFLDAQLSGAALLIDEADGLLGSAARSRMPMTAMPTSRSPICCSGWRRTRAWRS